MNPNQVPNQVPNHNLQYNNNNIKLKKNSDKYNNINNIIKNINQKFDNSENTNKNNNLDNKINENTNKLKYKKILNIKNNYLINFINNNYKIVETNFIMLVVYLLISCNTFDKIMNNFNIPLLDRYNQNYIRHVTKGFLFIIINNLIKKILYKKI